MGENRWSSVWGLLCWVSSAQSKAQGLSSAQADVAHRQAEKKEKKKMAFVNFSSGT